MKTIVTITALASVLLTSAAFAQMTSGKDSAPRTTTAPPAIANPMDTKKTMAAPVDGKNSFTEAQATTRLNDNGYSAVTGLKKDEQSVWHATAMKSGKKVMVALDYQGNITAKP